MTNRCIYCFDSSPETMSEAHLFPQSIGGRLSYRHCCAHCNNWLGHDLEARLLNSLFVAHGRAKLGIASKEEAFKQIPIIDPATGEDYKYVGEQLVGKAKMRTPSVRIAPPKHLRKLIRKDVQKRFPHWLEQYMRQYDDGARQIRLPGETHVFRVEKLFGPVEYRGKEFFPREFLAKVCYEAMILAGLFTEDSIRDFYKTTFEVYRSTVSPFRTRRTSSRGVLGY
jgi:hypothetical protein